MSIDVAARGAEEKEGVDIQVAGDVGECEIFRTEELNGRALEKGVVIFADESGVFWSISMRNGFISVDARAGYRDTPIASWQISWTFC
jgi:hypothetical protein